LSPLNRIGSAHVSRALQRAFDVRTGLIVDSIDTVVQPVVIVDDLTRLDVDPDSSYIDYVGTVEALPTAGNILQVAVNLNSNDFVMIEIQRVLFRLQLGSATTDFSVWSAVSTIFGFQAPYIRRVQRKPSPTGGPPEDTYASNRFTFTGAAPAVLAATRVIDASAIGSGQALVEPDMAIGPKNAVVFSTRTPASPASITVWWRERPFRNVGQG